jgi:carbamoyl-phosphate synthase large subunit
VILGPEMKSTGEVMGIDTDFGRAYAKSQVGAGSKLPDSGTVFISVKKRDKAAAAQLAGRLVALGFKLIATDGTAHFLRDTGLEVQEVKKVAEGRPNIEDAILSDQVQLVINTSEGAKAIEDSYSIRRSALMNNVAYYTTMTAASAVVRALEAVRGTTLAVAPLQSYFKGTF